MSIRSILAYETRLFTPFRLRLRDLTPRSSRRNQFLRFRSGAPSSPVNLLGEAGGASSGSFQALKDVVITDDTAQELFSKDEGDRGDVVDNKATDEDWMYEVSAEPAVLHLTTDEVDLRDLAGIHDLKRRDAWRFSFHSLHHIPTDKLEDAKRSTLRAAQRASAMSFAVGRSPEEIREQWYAMDWGSRTRRLPFILIGCLSISARLTLRVLKALPAFPHNFNIRMDCLLYLRRDKEMWRNIKAKEELYQDFQIQVTEIWLSPRWPPFAVSIHYVLLVLDQSPYEKACEFVEKYLEYYAQPPTDDLLRIVGYFTKKQDVDRAMAVMRCIKQCDLLESSQELLQRCRNILGLDTIDTNGDAKNFKILPQLLELGIKPNVVIHNMIIKNAIAAKLPGVAWDLYRYMLSEGLETNTVTHLQLMKDAFVREDVEGLNEMLSAIQARQDLFHDSHLIAHTMNIVRIINVYEKRSSPSETFSHVLSVYGRAFNFEILARLGMLQASVPAQPISTDLPNPPPALLASTIFMYVLSQTDRHIVEGLWAWLVRLLQEGDEQVLEASKFDTFYNAFIVFFGRSPYTLKRCPEILHYMLDNDQRKPTGRSWSMLMCAFLRQGQEEAAEQIRQTMLKRGFKPFSPAFDFVLRKWPQSQVAARARDAFEAGNAELQHYEVAGTMQAEESFRNKHTEPHTHEDIASIQDAELFEGLPLFSNSVPGKDVVQDEDTPWNRMIDLRPQIAEADRA